MFWLIVIALGGLALMAAKDGSDGSDGGAWTETLLEPPNAASPATAAYVTDLRADGSGVVRWYVSGGAGLATSGQAQSRDQAIADAYAEIEKHRGKLPGALNRHGLRVAADCSAVTVQNLTAWLAWAEPQIDIVAGELAAQDRLSGAQLMRGVWARAFPECGDATPKIRGLAWSRRVKQVQNIVDKQLAGDFIDVHPIGRVLAARMVGMSPPRVDGRAFFATAVDGSKWAVIVDKIDTAVGVRWRWRVWPETVGGLVREDGDEATEGAAADAAKAFVASMQASGAAWS
jgi:hypothetical protein